MSKTKIIICSICNLKISAKLPCLTCSCCNLYHHPSCVNIDINSNAFINFYSKQWMCHSCVNSVFPFYSIDNEDVQMLDSSYYYVTMGFVVQLCFALSFACTVVFRLSKLSSV